MFRLRVGIASRMALEEVTLESLVVELTEKMTVFQAKLLQVKLGEMPKGFSPHLLRTFAVDMNELVLSVSEPSENDVICSVLSCHPRRDIEYYYLETPQKRVYIDTKGKIQLMGNFDGSTNQVVKEVSFFVDGDSRTVRLYASNGYLLQYGTERPTTAPVSMESVSNRKSWFIRDQRRGEIHFFLRPYTDQNVCIRGTDRDDSPLEVTTQCSVRNLMFQGPINYRPM